MSGFGLKALKKEKSAAHEVMQRLFYTNIVFGNNLSAYLKYQDLKSTGEEVIWITSYQYGNTHALNDYNLIPEVIRTTELRDHMIDKEYDIEMNNYPVNFYKDGKVHALNSRTKIHELKKNEEYFTNGFYPINFQKFNLFSDEQIKADQKVCQLEKIERVEARDLAEESNYALYTGEFNVFECTNLYFCETAKYFLSHLENKAAMKDEEIKSLAQIQGQSALVITYECVKNVIDPQTIILPQSQTYDYGSIICDFLPIANNKQLVKALIFLEDEEKTEEILAKKVKLTKRLIKKAVEDFNPVAEPQIKYYNDFTMTDPTQGPLNIEGLSYAGFSTPLI